MEPLFKTTTEYTYDEYKKFNKEINVKNFKLKMYFSIYTLIFTFAAFIFFTDRNYLALVFCLTLIVAPIIILPMQINKLQKKIYNNYVSMHGTQTNISLYNDHLEVSNLMEHLSYPYVKISKIVETETNFYIMNRENRGMIIIKSNCSLELLEFLQELRLRFG